MFASTPDLLRLLAVPLLGWAAWRDIQTRRVPNAVWYPMAALGVLVLVWEGAGHLPPTDALDRLYLLRVGISLGFVVPLSYLFWRLGGFGGADAKALMALAVLAPVFPAYYLQTTTLPLVSTTLGVFSMTILTNTVVLGLLYPLALTLRNAARGVFSPLMFIGHRIPVDALRTAHGRLLETEEGFTRGGLDLDALRMYLRWRGTTLEAVRADPDAHRDPSSIGDTFDPTDGAVGAGPVTDGGAGPATDGGVADAADDASTDGLVDRPASGGAAPDGTAPAETPAFEDPWGAGAFLDSIEGSAYGTSPQGLRDGLELVARRDHVWVSPGIPFIVPMFLGLVVAFTYGDLLFGLLGMVGLG
jgi:preflagellin peptidase FlaK